MLEYKYKSLEAGTFKYKGRIDESIRFVQAKQLMDKKFWALFVDQYRIGNVDDHDLGWRGEYFGKMMRGSVLTYMYTLDQNLFDLLTDAVIDMLSTIDEMGRFATYSLDKEFQQWDMWSRKYVLLGMQYYLEICKEENLKERITDALILHADYILSKVGPEEGKMTITQTSKYWDGLNSSSILEPFVRLYVLTGFDRYLVFSKHIIDNGFLDSFNIVEAALEDKLSPYQYPVTKAYEMMSCFEGLLWYYRVTKEEKYLRASENFARKVIETDITLIGSAGCTHELFDHSKINQFDPNFKGIMQETCVTVTWMKLCYLLLQITGKDEYANCIEVSTYNALLGAINTQKIERINMIPAFDSYSPLRLGFRGEATGGLKQISEDKYYGCCIAIGAAATAISALASINKTERGFAFNSYIDGRVDTKSPKGHELSFLIDSAYPFKEDVRIEVKIKEGEDFEIDFRLPVDISSYKIKVNEQEQDKTINRSWSDGDIIDLSFKSKLELVLDTDLLVEAKDRLVRYGLLKKGSVVMTLDSKFNDLDIDKALSITRDTDHYVLNDYEYIEDYEGTSLALKLVTNEGSYTFTDYSSSGKSWEKEYPMAAWIKIK